MLVTGLLTRLARGKERGFLEGVLRLLQALPDTTRLVFLEDGDLPDDHPVLKMAAEREGGFVRRFVPPSSEALPGWIQQRARQSSTKVTLKVLRINPAQHLYRRLGFVQSGEDQTHLHMQWSPHVAPSAARSRKA